MRIQFAEVPLPRPAKAVAWAFVLLVLQGVLNSQVAPRTLTIRLLNGRSGKPQSNMNATLEWSPGHFMENTVINFGTDGIAKAEVPAGAEIVQILPGPKVGKEPYRIPYIDCTEPFMERIQIAQVLKNGYVTGNGCSLKRAVPRSGEIVFWARPKPWWQPDFQ